MGDFFGIDGHYVILANLIITLVLIILVLTLSSRLTAARKRFKQLLNGESNMDVEQLILQVQSKLNKHQDELKLTSDQVHAISNTLKKMKGKVGIHRYNAFSDAGSDLSFTLALLDDYHDGVLVTGIHSREQTYLYAKPITNGESKYTLSPEEKVAINLTVKQL
jgi:uncharacterized membrane protein YvbJ